MKLMLQVDKYDEWLYYDPKDPFGPAKIRDDAPEWAKKAYEEDTELIKRARKHGAYM